MVKSHGLALCRNRGEFVEILMCRRRNTYEFCEFVRNRYSSDEKLQKLFNNMTDDEKIAILTFNFDIVWFKFTSTVSRNVSYNMHKNTFSGLDQKKIRNMIELSTSGELLWEIPKGRANKDESSKEAAIREMLEELSITPQEYELLILPPKSHVVSEYGIKYSSKFHICRCINDRELLFCDRQNSEVSSSKWWNKVELSMLKDSNMANTAIEIINIFTAYQNKLDGHIHA